MGELASASLLKAITLRGQMVLLSPLTNPLYILVLSWLRACGVKTTVTFQTDWGQEFWGDNPDQISPKAK
jgi:hypothetical protein